MCRDTAAVGPSVRDDEAWDHHGGVPAKPASDTAREPCLLVELRGYPIGFIDSRLELSHQEGRGRGVEGQLIDAASLAVFAVGDLCASLPAVASHDAPALAQRRVIGVKQPIQLAATPPNEEEQRGVQCLEQMPQGWSEHARTLPRSTRDTTDRLHPTREPRPCCVQLRWWRSARSARPIRSGVMTQGCRRDPYRPLTDRL
jgi:hypothetical protein